MLKDDLLNIADLVRETRVSRSTINRWVKEGLLTPIKIGNVKLYSVRITLKLKSQMK